MNLLSKILAKCGGAHVDTLKKCPSESSKYASVGITIIFTGIFAALSGGYAFYKVFNKEISTSAGQIEDTFFYGAIGMGILWGFMIFNLDRFIVMSMKKQNNIGKEFLVAAPRIALAIIISLVVAKPLEVRLFQDRITAQVSDNELEKREQNRQRIYGITDKTAIDSLKTSSEDKVTDIRAQLKQECPTKECKDAFDAQKAAYDNYLKVKSQVQPLISDADRNIQFIKKDDKFRIFTQDENGVMVRTNRYTVEGDNKLKYYRNIFNTNVAKRDAERERYRSKLATYNTLNTRYKNSKREELEAAESRDKDLATQKSEADKQTLELEKKSSEAANIAYTNNFITQIEALGDLTKWNYDKLDENGNVIEKANNTMWYMNLAIILLFIVIETAPVFVKLISSKGQYDIALEADDTKKESEFIHEANTDIAIAEQKSQLQLQALMNNQQAQLGMLQTAIMSWQNQKTAELNNGTMSDAEYKKIIQEILEFDIISNKMKMNSKKKKPSIFSLIIKKIKRRINTGHNKVQNGNTP